MCKFLFVCLLIAGHTLDGTKGIKRTSEFGHQGAIQTKLIFLPLHYDKNATQPVISVLQETLVCFM